MCGAGQRLPRIRDKGGGGSSPSTPVGRAGGVDLDGDGKIENEEMSPTENMMMIT